MHSLVVCNRSLESGILSVQMESGLSFFGVYLVCNGGCHVWPCLILPSRKRLVPDSPEKQKTKKYMESVQWDIDGMFGFDS